MTLDETRIFTLQEFLKYAPLGLELDHYWHYDASKEYPWRYNDDKLDGCWRYFQYSEDEEVPRYDGPRSSWSDGEELTITKLPRPIIRRKNKI